MKTFNYKSSLLTPLSLLSLLSLLVIGAFSLPLHAQFDQTIEVSGEYIPEVIDHNPLSTFPPAIKFPLSSATLDYDLDPVTADFAPRAVSLSATEWNAAPRFNSSRGYVDFMIGSWLNASLAAGYRFVDSPKTTAGVAFNHVSSSLWKPKVNGNQYANPLWRYDESLSLYASHQLSPYISMSANAAWNLGFFNYYGLDVADGQPDQTLNRGSLSLAVGSAPSSSQLTWKTAIGARYFGFRSLYLPTPHSSNGYESMQADRETILNLDADLGYAFNNSSAINLGLDADWILYAGRPDIFINSHIFGKPDNYGLITLSPSYTFSSLSSLSSSGLALKIGLRAELSPGLNDYSIFHIAPDVHFDFSSGPFALFLDATGGQQLRTLNREYELDAYCAPVIFDNRPVYSPFDGKIGFRVGPFSGVSIGADFAYRISRNLTYGGYYSYAISPDLSSASSVSSLSISDDQRYDLSGFSVGMNLALNLLPWFNLDAEARYQPQSRSHGFFNGYDRARWDIALKAETNPWSPLRIGLDWNWRADRTLFLPASEYSLADLSILAAKISYEITPDIVVYLRGENLLNRHDEILPALPAQGISIMAGAGFNF
ncbi:MAG: hypothetical protein HDS24_03895 [Bacteroides sp.]|nr:hypothetical protein [Bacteroides sp.]